MGGEAERGTQTCMLLLAPVDKVSTDAYKVKPLPVLREHCRAVQQLVVDAIAYCLDTCSNKLVPLHYECMTSGKKRRLIQQRLYL